MEKNQNDLQHDYITATRVYGASMEPAYNRLKQTSPDVAAVVDVYKSIEKQADVNLVNSDDSHHRNAYEVLGKLAQSRAESAKVESSDPVDVQRAARLLLSNDKATPEMVEQTLDGTARTREYMTRLSMAATEIKNAEITSKFIDDQFKISPQFAERLKEVIQAPDQQRAETWHKLYNDINEGKLDGYPHDKAKFENNVSQLNQVGQELAKLTPAQQGLLAEQHPAFKESLDVHHALLAQQNQNAQSMSL